MNGTIYCFVLELVHSHGMLSKISCQECLIFRETTFFQNFLLTTTQKNAEQTPVGEEGGKIPVAEVYALHWCTNSLMAVYP